MPRPRGPATARRVTALGAGTSPQSSQDRSGAISTAGVVSKSTIITDTMPERVFQAHVVAGLRERGWAVFVIPDMRKTRAGLPDIVALGPVSGPRRGPVRLLFWELKSQRGRIRPEQQNVIQYLQMVAGDIDARIVRPADWPQLRDALDAGALIEEATHAS